MERKKKLAYTLYVDNGFDQKVIAQITGISETSIGNWKRKSAQEGVDWDEERRATKMGPDKVMRRILRLYDRMLSSIESRDEPDNVPNSKESDVLNKLADSAKKLQSDLTFFVKSEVGKQFITYIQQTHGQARAIEVVELWHEYLMSTT